MSRSCIPCTTPACALVTSIWIHRLAPELLANEPSLRPPSKLQHGDVYLTDSPTAVSAEAVQPDNLMLQSDD